MTVHDKCTVHRIPLRELPGAVHDPALNTLLREGWEVLFTLATEERGEPALHVVMRPPQRRRGATGGQGWVLAAILGVVAWQGVLTALLAGVPLPW